MSIMKRQLGSVALLALAGFFTACGGTSYQEGQPPSMNPEPVIPGPSPTPTPTLGVPPISYGFEIQGSGTAAYTVETDNLLKVRIRPDTAGLVGGTGYTPVYGCIKYTITVIGKSVSTQVLRIGGGGSTCQDAPESQIIDFSDRLGPGHNSATVTISAVQTDWKYTQCMTSPWLWLYPYTSYFSCESYGRMNNLYTTHKATGMIDIQVNGTDL